MSVKMRQEVECKIASRLIRDALAAGYAVAVKDGGEVFGPYRSCKTVLGKMFSVDEEHLMFYRDGERPGEYRKVGWAFFVYGNSGWDVISDYSTSMEHIMAGANKISDHYS